MRTQSKTEYAQSIFSVAQTDIAAAPFGNHGRTLRLVVVGNVHAHALRVRFTNYCGTTPLTVGAASLARSDEAGVLTAGTLLPLTVGGHLSFELPPGADVYSDDLAFSLQPGDAFAVNLYYPTGERVQSGNWLGRSALRSRPGNFSAELCLPGPNLVSRFARTVITTDMTVLTTNVAQIDALCHTPGRVVGCFGDSITQQCNWTTPLEKLLHTRWPGSISLCNLGISGNRLLNPSPPTVNGLFGPAGIHRFEHDLLGLSGLTHAVLALGANDLGHPGSYGAPAGQLPSPAEYTGAMEKLADTLHGRGVKVFAATITPRTYTPPYSETRDELRKMLNGWIRTAPCFDAVFDFDRVLARTDGKPGMKDHCALYDGLHPSPYGGLLLAKSINLDLFGEGANG